MIYLSNFPPNPLNNFSLRKNEYKKPFYSRTVSDIEYIIKYQLVKLNICIRNNIRSVPKCSETQKNNGCKSDTVGQSSEGVKVLSSLKQVN